MIIFYNSFFFNFFYRKKFLFIYLFVCYVLYERHLLIICKFCLLRAFPSNAKAFFSSVQFIFVEGRRKMSNRDILCIFCIYLCAWLYIHIYTVLIPIHYCSVLLRDVLQWIMILLTYRNFHHHYGAATNFRFFHFYLAAPIPRLMLWKRLLDTV